MANNKKSFLFYCDWQETFNALPDEKAGELIKHLLAYVNDENPVSNDILINAVFANIKHTLKRDLKKWEHKSKQNKENALKRWNANACERIKSDANYADRDIDRDIVKDKVIVNDINKRKEIKEKIAFEKCSPTTLQTDEFSLFLDYWFEHGDNDKKMRFEKEKSFDWSRRWKTWLRNKENWQKEKLAPKEKGKAEELLESYEYVKRQIELEHGQSTGNN